MKKTIILLTFGLLLLSGCQNEKNQTLDTSKLEKMEASKEAEESGIVYQAPSVKVGLDAIPFEIKLPKKLPFKTESFQAPIIYDNSRDGKKVTIEISTASKKTEDHVFLKMIAFNDEFLEIDQEGQKLTLKNNITGYYNQNLLNFEQKDISYTIFYMNQSITQEEHQKQIIDLANQIIQ